MSVMDQPEGVDPLREHEFDGIHEFDNRLPNWWLWTFYLACIFSLFYWLHFHVIGSGDLPREAYQAEMKAAADALAEKMSQMEVTDESLSKMASEPSIVAAGQQVFKETCATCHTETGGGNIGPNLTDEYWVHGGKPTDIYKVVTEGVQGTAMVSWTGSLGLRRCQEVTAFVLSIKNTNVPGGKEPDMTRARKESE
jgi:cytochrome c oxidase cbb3-type subunit 3